MEDLDTVYIRLCTSPVLEAWSSIPAYQKYSLFVLLAGTRTAIMDRLESCAPL